MFAAYPVPPPAAASPFGMVTAKGRLIQMKRLLPALLAAFLLTGCSTYYRVTDTKSNRVYYTKSLSDKKSGAVQFKDASSEEKVTLMAHSVKKISKDEFNSNVNKEAGPDKKGW